MPSTSSLVFSRLYLPRPLDTSAVAAFLTRLASDKDAPRVALELRADQDGGVRHLLGCPATDVQALRRLLRDLIPGSLLTKSAHGEAPARPDVDVTGRLRMQPRSLPLRSDAPEATTRALLSAMAVPLKVGEVAVLQVVLGPRRSPRVVPANTPDPGTTLVDALTRGDRPAGSETRARLRERFSQAGFAATIRIGAASPDRGRRRRFVMNLLGALSTAQSPGVQLDLARQPAKHLNDVRMPWRWPLHLSVAELVGLLGWPIGEDDLPGLPPAHPKPLRPATNVHTGPRVFAQSAVPGDERLVGISPKDQTFHAVAYGPSGSGKTNALLHLILADIEEGRPVAVLDPKRQLIDDILARIPEERIPDVVELNASDTRPVGFNPLDVAGRDPDVVVDGILAVFEAVFADGWGPRSADIFSAALRTLARASTPKRPATLVDLPRLLTDPRFRRQQVGRVQSDMALAGFWSWYEAQSPQAQAAAIAPPLNKLRQFLLRPALIRLLDQRSGRFRLRDIFRENKIVLVPLNEGLIGPGTASLLGSLIIADLWQAAQERADEPDADKRQGVVYVDEAPRFLNLPVSLADALAVSRSLSVGWFLAAQFRGQFPKDLRSAVDMNARSKIVFATEYEDARDIAKLSRDLTPEDFMALPRFHAYANLVADGIPSAWALVKTLPPRPATTDPERVRAASRETYAAELIDAADDSGEAATPPPPAASTAPAGLIDPAQIGRKRRQR
ncbi:type IV secretory system conjugative DNA transfer family protein [Amycolatopsis thermalba]|uniref:Type IV secretory system conjugative DNA transfer family protein n=1 Tax=Amycolatopsis thermalba TaxID=944492 RepID=A0ABY4NS22_9PSEU|nr:MULTISPECIES: type IV secretory system conjugative DNA transfer family protein [Amycolatopsis]UQS22852.1 type IV secretory system conjugative DNA transfer family protein [Amycolatopsis thermalba]